MEKVYVTKTLVERLTNALENGYEELGETDIGDLLLECEEQITTPDLVWPRRAKVEAMTKEELALFNLMGEIDNLGCHPLLTDVVVLLQSARDKLADWVELPANKPDEVG